MSEREGRPSSPSTAVDLGDKVHLAVGICRRAPAAEAHPRARCNCWCKLPQVPRTQSYQRAPNTMAYYLARIRAAAQSAPGLPRPRRMPDAEAARRPASVPSLSCTSLRPNIVPESADHIVSRCRAIGCRKGTPPGVRGSMRAVLAERQTLSTSRIRCPATSIAPRGWPAPCAGPSPDGRRADLGVRSGRKLVLLEVSPALFCLTSRTKPIASGIVG